MDRLALFIPLAKADAAQRLVYGYFDETPDRSGEIFDYETSKPLIEAWSGEIAKASDGKSFGNVRAQHGRNAAGKLIDITFDDDLKKVGFCAKIVDDDEWKKVEEGVYTGFSPGGRYAKRWQANDGKRYTADVKELSIVDVPCNPAATFTMIKADGAEEEREFTLAKAYEPGNEATIERADALAKAAGKPDRRNDFLVKARAELIAENADAALAKMAADEIETNAKPDPVAKLDAALAKAAVVVPDVEAPAFVLEDMARNGGALALLAKSAEGNPLLAKSFYTLSTLASILNRVGDLACSVAYEERSENDTDSKLPAMALALVKAVNDFLIEMAREETAELVASVTTVSPDLAFVIPVSDDPSVMELASGIVDLVKADGALMEKAGKRNSAKDQSMIQTMHDHSVSLGATCEADAKKGALAEIEADRDRLAKAIDESAPKIEAMVERMEKMSSDHADTRDKLEKALAEIATLKEQPEPAKGVLIQMEKAASAEEKEPSLSEKIAALPNGPVKQAAILASVGKHR